MQIKDEQNYSLSGTEDDAMSIHSSIENLRFFPMSEELKEKIQRTQELLDTWSINRRKMVREMERIAEKINNWEEGCAISTTVGSSVGVASGVAVIGGIVLMPTVAIAGLIVGTAAGLSNVATGITKMIVMKSLVGDVTKMIEEDKILFEKLYKSRAELMDTIKQLFEDAEFNEHFKNYEDIENVLKTIFGGSVLGITGCGTKFAISSLGRLSSTFVKGVLHSIAVIGIVLDSVTLFMSAKTLKEGASTELASSILKSSARVELTRQKVVKCFLNEDVWNDEDKPLSDVGSDFGSAVFVNPTESLIQQKMETL